MVVVVVDFLVPAVVVAIVVFVAVVADVVIVVLPSAKMKRIAKIDALKTDDDLPKIIPARFVEIITLKRALNFFKTFAQKQFFSRGEKREVKICSSLVSNDGKRIFFEI